MNLRIEPAMRWALACVLVSAVQPYAETQGLRTPVMVVALLLALAALYRSHRDDQVVLARDKGRRGR